ncbi:HpcH/HpaI aldolase family protein [Paenibacillus cymbidii]|uniref:HpcH/HpaI aldolase family protein n=1 Tax=Paenibacillus cymbidii TaxID=1639034 RepID=UPI00107FEDC3|nr:aldolase/citrate lyase family protein [Paenibacillus cymbidii]
MRRSRVLEKLRAGEVALCIKLNLADSRVAEIAALAGFDCIWTDREHVANDWNVIEKMVMAAKMHDVDTVVRVDRGGYSDYVRPLELDATAIMVPHVMSLEDARAVVKTTKFHPLGMRPIDGGNADGAYTRLDFMEYLRVANEQRFNILQIEDVEPLDELEEIIKLPGLDMIFFGPGDFTQSIGEPGNFTHPKLLETRKRIGELAAKHGKFAGTVGGLGNAEELIGLGYRFISLGADVVALSGYFDNIISTMGKLSPVAGRTLAQAAAQGTAGRSGDSIYGGKSI